MILIKNACAIEFDPPRVREGMDILIDGKTIVAVGAGLDADADASGTARTGKKIEKTIDATGKIVFPGIVCSHHHIYSALSRGIQASIGPTPDFVSVLRQLWWRLDQAIDEDILHFSTITASLDALRCGTTAVIDHHASPNFIEGSLDVIRQGMELTGIRGATCYEVSDRHGRDGMIAGIEENRRFASEIKAARASRDAGGLVEAHIGGHAPCTLPEEALERMGDVIRETGRGLHLHVAEDRYDVSHSHVTYGEDIVSRLERHGLLNDRTLLIHGVHLSEAEIEILNARDGFLVHNARSNMNNNVGYNHNLPKLKNLALGTDGIGADMVAEIQSAYFKHKDEGGAWWPGDFFGALQAGNRILERNFGERFGRLEEGYMADIVVADYNAPTPLVPENIAGHFVFGASSGMTETVIVNGKIVMENRAFGGAIDEEVIYKEAAKQAKRMWVEMDKIAP